MRKKIICLLILLHASGLGRKRIGQLLNDFGSPEAVIESAKDPELLFGKWKVGPWEKDLEAAEKNQIALICYEDPLYPKNLLKIPDFPLLLYVKGTFPAPETKSVAIIGTRNASLYGKQAAEQIARELATQGLCVISGLARGIDTAAHLGALSGGGKTLAILGSGLLNVYPQENRLLAEKISEQGAVISEFPMHTAPAKGLFPQRNRIVSGMSDLVFLAESPLEGGGMLTMQLAQIQEKPCFALPGRIDWPSFCGNHHLIKTGKAKLAENSQDLIINFTQNTQMKHYAPELPLLSPEEKLFLSRLPSEEKSIEELVMLTQLPIMQLNVMLVRLQLKKVVKEFPGKIYKKLL